MKKTAALVCALASTAAIAATSFPVRPPPSHPIIGKWQWTRAENKCTEVYEFKADGTAPVTSGTEKTDNTYTVAATPDLNDFYRHTMTVIKDYGGKDCGDDESESSGESTNYIIFDPTKTMYLSCVEPKLEKCFGPLQKVLP